MNTKYIFLDVDGTLINNYIPIVPESTKLAIAKAKANGHKIFISSGRCYPDIAQCIKDLNPDGYVLSVGAHVICENKTFLKQVIDPKLALTTFQNILDNNIGLKVECVNSIHAFLKAQDFARNNDKALGIDVDDKSYIEYLNNKNIYFDDSIIDLIRHNEFDYLKITTFDDDKEKMAKVLSTISDEFAYYIDKVMTGDTYFGEIKLKDVDKGTGIAAVLKYYNANIEDTLSIGDSLNDLEMIEYTNIGICMGNGCDALKEKADYVTTSVEEDGVYNAFKHFGLI